jgi:hypothetical protein
MTLTSVRCHVLGGRVSLLTTLEGEVARVICPAYESATAGCRIKRQGTGGGPLSDLLERVAEDALGVRRTTRCDFHG